MIQCIPFYPHPALSIYESKSVSKNHFIAITDLHLGFEHKIIDKGIYFSIDNSLEGFKQDIYRMIKESNANGLIILGDLYDKVENKNYQYLNVVNEFLNFLSKEIEVYFIPGNHDGGVSNKIPKNVNQIRTSGMIIDDTILIHGHTIPKINSSVNRIIMGHIHPVFHNRNSILNGQRVWIYIKTNKNILSNENGDLDIIIVPAFNNFLTLSRLKSKRYSNTISKVMENVNKIKDCKIITLDGHIVGNETLLQQIIQPIQK